MSKKILVADDSVVIQKSIGITFAQEDFQVTFVGNGEEAYQRATEWRPDLILADTSMPKLSGAELFKKFRQHPDFRRTPMMLLASSQEKFSEAQLKSFGADDFIQKPFESTQLLEKVKSLINKASSPAISKASLEKSLDNTFTQTVAADDETMAAYSSGSADQTPSELDRSEEFIPNAMDLQDFSTPESVETLASMQEPSEEGFLGFGNSGGFDAHPDAETKIVKPGASFTASPSQRPQQPARATVSAKPAVAMPSMSTTNVAPSANPAPTTLNLSEKQIEQIVSKVFQNVIERIAWEVVPDLAERLIKEEIEKLTTEK